MSGLDTLTTTLTTMVAISIGVLVGYGTLPFGRTALPRGSGRRRQLLADNPEGSHQPRR